MRKALLVVALFAAGLAVALPAKAQTPRLIATVGLKKSPNAYKISLTFPNGQRVTTLPAGTYAIVVHDYSKIHNFALGSQTANQRIFTGSVPGTGTKTYTVTLAAGNYAYACSAHPFVMNGTFVVTDSSTTTS